MTRKHALPLKIVVISDIKNPVLAELNSIIPERPRTQEEFWSGNLGFVVMRDEDPDTDILTLVIGPNECYHKEIVDAYHKLGGRGQVDGGGHVYFYSFYRERWVWWSFIITGSSGSYGVFTPDLLRCGDAIREAFEPFKLEVQIKLIEHFSSQFTSAVFVDY